MAHLSYEEQKKLVFKGLKLLAIVTITEVFFALLFNGHIFHGFHKAHISDSRFIIITLALVYGVIMVGFSLYKARFIVYHFMHLGQEVRGMRMSVLLPMLLLVWAIIAFFQEGNSWGARRHQIEEKNKEEVGTKTSTGSLECDESLYKELI